MQKIFVVLGPTASGKSDLAVQLALKHGGEVISADSRQVYRGLDIGTGKITSAEMKGVPHHLLDVADPARRFTAMDWKEMAEKAIEDIISRGKLPIVCGGTGFYISALVDGLGFPDVQADPAEQRDLEARPPEELLAELQRLDPSRAATIDPKNKRRLARAIIIARALGSVPPVSRSSPRYDAIMIGIRLPDDELRRRIHDRLVGRIDAGMIEEARRLHAAPPEGQGLSYERMDELGLEYRYLALLLQGKISREELVEKLSAKIWQYSRRQMTWFKKDQRIRWLTPREALDIDLTI